MSNDVASANGSLYVPIEEVMCETGLTKHQVFRDVRNGRLPGEIVREKVRLRRAVWEAYKAGEWQPRREIGLVRRSVA